MPYRVSSAEFARLSSLYRYGIADARPDPAIDHALRTLGAHLEAPVAQFLLADAQSFHAKSSIGEVGPVFPRGSGVVEELLTGGPAFRAETDRLEGLPPAAEPLRSFAGLRLTGDDDEAYGVLYVADVRPRDLMGHAAEMLVATAAEIRTLLESYRRARQDQRTGALLRDAFVDQGRRLIEVSRMGRQAISLVAIDLGTFRAALDARASGLSNLLIRQMADLGRTQVRRRDSFGRLDPDRFAVLLTDTGEAGARVLAQRLTRHLEGGWVEAGLGTMGLDLGIGSMKPLAAGDTIEVLMERATPAHWPVPLDQPGSHVA